MKFVLPSFAILILIFLIDLYCFQSVKTVSQNLGSGSRKLIYSVFWGFTCFSVLMVVLNIFKSHLSVPRVVTVYGIGLVMIIYACKVIIVAFLLIDDVIRLGRWVVSLFTAQKEIIAPDHPQITRSLFINQMAMVTAVLPFGALIYGMVFGAFDYNIKRIKLAFSNLPKSFDGLRIVQISDIHSGSFVETHHLQRAVDMVNAQKADIILFTGDLVNSKTDEVYPYLDVLKQIKAPMGVYASLGNHDYGDYYDWPSHEDKVNNLAALFEVYQKLGWDLLLNENRIFTKNGEKIAIAGCENWGAFARFPKYGDLEKSTRNLEDIPFTLLMSHDPSHWDAQVLGSKHKIDLQLAGHTHGMQFGVDTKLIKWSPVQYMYKEWAGLYRKDDQYLYVNRGLGFIGYPGRAGIRPEITVIDLVCKG